jgi:hypothetical protein
MAQKEQSFRALADRMTVFGLSAPSSRLANSLVLRCNIPSGSKEK